MVIFLSAEVNKCWLISNCRQLSKRIVHITLWKHNLSIKQKQCLYLKTYSLYPYFCLFLLPHAWIAVQWHWVQKSAERFYVQLFGDALSGQEILVDKQSLFLKTKLDVISAFSEASDSFPQFLSEKVSFDFWRQFYWIQNSKQLIFHSLKAKCFTPVPSCFHGFWKEKWKWSRSVVSDSLQPHRL